MRMLPQQHSILPHKKTREAQESEDSSIEKWLDGLAAYRRRRHATAMIKVIIRLDIRNVRLSRFDDGR